MLRLSFQNALSQFDLFSEVITQRSEHGQRRPALRARRRGGRGAAAAGPVLRGPAGGLLAAPRAGRRDPPGPDPAAGRRRQPGRAHPDPARADDRLRHRVLAGARGRPSGRGAAAAGRVAAGAAAPRSGCARACGRPGICGTAGSPRSWPTSGRSARIGIGSTLGLIGLVSLPRGFVFRPSDDDPHPMPWVRVLLSCAIGDRLYPDPQWDRLAATWRAMYPLAGVRPQLAGDHRRAAGHHAGPRHGAGRAPPGPAARPVARRGAPQPGAATATALLRRFSDWEADPSRMALAPPTLAFAVLGQARASGRLSPERESRLLRRLITSWAVTQLARDGPRHHPVRRRDVRRPAHDLGRPTRPPNRPSARHAPQSDWRNDDDRLRPIANGPAATATIDVDAQPTRITAGGIVLLTAEPPADRPARSTSSGPSRDRCRCRRHDTRIAAARHHDRHRRARWTLGRRDQPRSGRPWTPARWPSAPGGSASG